MGPLVNSSMCWRRVEITGSGTGEATRGECSCHIGKKLPRLIASTGRWRTLSVVDEHEPTSRAVYRIDDNPSDDEYDPYCPPQCGHPVPGRPLIPVRLSPDYDAELPLWGDWPHDTRLPDDLRDRLAAWQAEFNENYGGRWTKEIRERWAAQADGLADALRKVLDGKAALEVDLWPI